MTDGASFATPADVLAVMALIPHRFPMLLVDRVEDIILNQSARGIKAVTINEPFFAGHFPARPIMPGVLIIEALAQACGILVHLSHDQNPAVRPLYYLVKIDKARFSRIVSPGDQLVLEVEMKRVVMKMGQFHVRALVDGAEVASAELMCAERAP